MTLLIAVASVEAIAMVVVMTIRRPLFGTLVELCGNQQRAGFWRAFADVFLVLVSLVATLFSAPPSKVDADVQVLRDLLLPLRAGLLGLLFATIFVAVGMSVFVLWSMRREGPRP